MVGQTQSAYPLRCKTNIERLRRVSILRDLSDVELDELACRAALKRWRAGAIVVAQDELPSGLYIVAEGRAKSVLFGENGREMTLAVLKPGDFFGECSLLQDATLEANVVAIDDLLLLVIDRALFLELLSTNRQTALRLLTEMAARLRRADELIGDLALRDVGARLQRTLVSLAEERGESRPDGIYIKRRPTQQDLANMVGTCRETVSRLLSAMSKAGLVVAHGRSLLLRPALLESLHEAA